MLELIRAGIKEDEQVDGVDKLDELPAPRAMLLFVTRPGVVSESMLHAVEHEFPDLMIKQVDHIAAASQEFALPVSLLLIETSLLAAAGPLVSDLNRFHPHAYAAAIQPRGYHGGLPEILNSQFVRGVLPMNVTLDVWLSVIRLLLHGGEYFPLDLVVRSYSKGANGSNKFNQTSSLPGAHRAPGAPLSELTTREMQILEMVSHGLPNKRIAAEFHLSEHTVKIHMHNIITKLGVHNRTGAVARFRDGSWQART